MREKLQSASETKDKSALQEAINKSLALGLPELDADILQAKELLKELGDLPKGSLSADTLLGKLKRAIRRKNRMNLEKVINECVASGFPELSPEIQEARHILKELEVLEDEKEGWLLA